MGGGSEEGPSYWTVPFMSSWREEIVLRSLGGHPIFCRGVNRPALLTRSNALVRSTKAMNRGRLCSRHFSCSCLRENIISIVDLSARNPHCRQLQFVRYNRGEGLPDNVEHDDVGIAHVLRHSSILPAL
ncbi:hypothetical protein ACOMHN_049377 [Nucella lapillus]